MVATESELQIPTPQLQDLGDDRNLVSLLRRRVAAREPFAADSSIQEADVYSAAPAELVRCHAPGMDPSEGKEMAWYFFSPANYHETPGARRRKRKVGGPDAGETCCWHPEAGKVPILGPDKKPVGAYKRKLSYVLKIKNPPGSAKPYRNKSLGWIMVEIGLEQEQADQQLVLCKVYKSPRPRWDAEISIEACSLDGDEKPCLAPLPPAAALSSCDSQVTERKATTLGYRKPPPSTHHAFKHGIRSRPMEENRRGVAIVKKAAAAAVTVVMKFSGSLTQSGDGMKEMAKLVRSFPDGGGESPVVVLSAMGNTTNNLLLAAGKALSLRPQEASEIHELVITKELHFRMVDDLGLQRSIASGSLDELENIFMAIAVMKELTSKTRDYLVSFGEHMSTRIFSAYLNKLGEGARQEWELFALDTYGRGGSDLTTTTIGRVFGSREIQVWKDVDGVLTCDPNVCANAIPLPYLTFDEAVELGLFDGQSMQLAMEGGIPVIVKNLYNPEAPGTMITKTRDMSKSVLTSIVSRSNITVLSIESTRMLDHSVFLARSFSTFADLGMPVDCVAISEGKISLIVVPSKLWSHELFQLELDNVVEELQKFAVVYWLQDRSVISLTGGTQTSPSILLKAFNVLHSINVEVQKFSQGSSKVMKVSLVVNDTEAKHCVQALHSVFFEMGFVSEVQGTERELNASPEQMPVNSPAAPASFGDKIKVDDDHLEASLSVCKQQRTDTDGRSSVVEETERTAFSDKAGNPPELFEDDGGVPEVPEVQPKEEEQQHVLPVSVRESSSAPEAVQPEQQARVEVGESSSGPPAPGALEDETEGSHHPMTDDNALEDIRRRILADDSGGYQQWGDSGVDHPWDETEPQFFNNNSTTIGGDADGAFNYFCNNINGTHIEHVRVDAGTGLIEEASHIALLDIPCRLFSNKDPMHDGGDNGGDPDGYLANILQADDNLDDTRVLPVEGGEQAVPLSAPGVVTVDDVSRTGFPDEWHFNSSDVA